MTSEDWVTLVSGLQQMLTLLLFCGVLMLAFLFFGKLLDHPGWAMLRKEEWSSKETKKRRQRIAAWALPVFMGCMALLYCYFTFYPIFSYAPGVKRELIDEDLKYTMSGMSVGGYTKILGPRIAIRVLAVDQDKVDYVAHYFPVGSMKIRLYYNDGLDVCYYVSGRYVNSVWGH